MDGGLRHSILEDRMARTTEGYYAEAQLMAIACGTPPEGRMRWTLRLLVDRLVGFGVTDCILYETVRQTLEKKLSFQ